MGIKTKIDWCDATWNPVTGCLNGCTYCYARRIAERFRSREIHDTELACQRHLIERGMLIGTGKPIELDYPWEQRNKDRSITNAAYPFGFEPTFHRYRLDEPQKWKKPRNIFVCSMGDLFGDWVPTEWIKEVFAACEKAPQHRYLFLTKNPKRYTDLGNHGVCMPTTVDAYFGFSMDGVYAPKRPLPRGWTTFCSVEPLLTRLTETEIRDAVATEWVIIGAETGNRKGKVTPEKEWIDAIVRKARENDTAVFMKESLREIMGSEFVQEYPWI